jgi:hypothetical protein
MAADRTTEPCGAMAGTSDLKTRSLLGWPSWCIGGLKTGSLLGDPGVTAPVCMASLLAVGGAGSWVLLSMAEVPST